MRVSSVIFLLLIGCVVRPVEETGPSQLFQLPKPQVQDSSDDQPEELEDPEEPIVLFSATDQSGEPEEQHWSEELSIKSIEMEVISEWDDGSNYHIAIRFTNSTEDSVNANLNIYAYDRTGRLVRTRFEGTINFRPRSVTTREYRFAKRGREVRWIFSLTGKG